MVLKHAQGIDAIDAILLVARYAGLYCNSKWNWLRRICYYCYAFTIWIFVTCPMYFEVTDAYRHFTEKDYKTVFLIIGVVINAFGYQFIIYNYFSRKTDFLEVMDTIKLGVKKAFHYSPEIARKIHASHESLAKRFIIASIFTYETMWILWCSPPVVAFMIRYPDVNYSTLPLTYGTQNYGLDERAPPSFWLIIVIQFIHGVATLAGICFGNILTPILCILIASQIDILNSSLKILNFPRESGKKKEVLESRDALSRYQEIFQSPRHTSEEDFGVVEAANNQDEQFIKCIEHHQIIIRIVSNIKPALAPNLFVVLMTSIISFTNFMILFAMYDCDVLTKTIFSATVVIFVILLLFETWILTVLRSKLSEVSTCLYNAEWSEIRKNPKRKQDILIISQFSLHLVRFPIIMYTNLDFRRLYQLFNLAWNYFSLMMNMSSKLKA